MDQYDHSYQLMATIMVSNKCPVIGEQVIVSLRYYKLPWQQYNLLKTPLILTESVYKSQMSSVRSGSLSSFVSHEHLKKTKIKGVFNRLQVTITS